MRLYAWLFRSDIPNIIQVATFLWSVAIGTYALRKFNCKVKGCPRLGKHPVAGTTYRTCSKHATIENHEALVQKHAIERPEQHKLLKGA